MAGQETWIALVVSALVAVLLSAYAFHTAHAGKRINQRVAKEGGTVLLGAWTMDAFHWLLRGVGRLLLATRVSPDALTWTSLVITLGTIPLAALGHFALAGLAFLVGAAFDGFDGIVARARKTASDAGEVLDAVIDRYADPAPLAGLVIYYRGSVAAMAVPLAAMVGSAMVPYVRAKAEAMGIQLAPGMMRRHERIAYLGVALIFGPVLSRWLDGPVGLEHSATLLVVAFIALMANVAAFKLAAETRARLIAAGRGPGGPG